MDTSAGVPTLPGGDTINVQATAAQQQWPQHQQYWDPSAQTQQYTGQYDAAWQQYHAAQAAGQPAQLDPTQWQHSQTQPTWTGAASAPNMQWSQTQGQHPAQHWQPQPPSGATPDAHWHQDGGAGWSGYQQQPWPQQPAAHEPVEDGSGQPAQIQQSSGPLAPGTADAQPPTEAIPVGDPPGPCDYLGSAPALPTQDVMAGAPSMELPPLPPPDEAPPPSEQPPPPPPPTDAEPPADPPAPAIAPLPPPAPPPPGASAETVAPSTSEYAGAADSQQQQQPQQQQWTEQQIAEWHQQQQHHQYWEQHNQGQWHDQQTYWQQQHAHAYHQQAWPYTSAAHISHQQATYAAGAWPAASGGYDPVASAAWPAAAATSEPTVAQLTAPAVAAPLVSAADLFLSPGRATRPSRLVVVLRGPPGCGKSTAAKKIREAELTAGAEAPRTHSIDDYFMTDVEVEVDDEKRKGRKKKITVMEYEYDADMEASYEESVLKAYGKTVKEGKFRVVVVDAPHLRAAPLQDYWRLGQAAGYEVFVAGPLSTDPQVCTERNVHSRSLDEVTKAVESLEAAPPAFLRLDLAPLFQPAQPSEPDAQTTSANNGSDTSMASQDGSAMEVDTDGRPQGGVAPLPPNSDSDSDAGDSEGPTTPPSAKSRWAELDDDDGSEQEEERRPKRRRTADSAATAAAATVAPGFSTPPPVDRARSRRDSVLRGILSAGGSGNRVRWPDEKPAAGHSVAFSVGGASKEQLETVYVLEGLGPPMDDEQRQSLGSSSFQDQVKGEHVSEQQLFQRHLLGGHHA